MKKNQLLIFAILLLLMPSCDFPKYYFKAAPECKSDTSKDLTTANQQPLITTLKAKAPTDYRYFFKTFIEEGNNTFMITNFRNEEDCFDVKVLVDRWDKLTGMKRTNGKSYPKELYNLQWEIKSSNGVAIVKYLDMHRIID